MSKAKIRTIIAVACMGLTGLCLASCGYMELEDPLGGSMGGKADDPNSVATESLSLLTYNVGLAYDAVALAEERQSHIVSALASQTADVVCLQEVWTDEDAEMISAALADSYPHQFRFRTEDITPKSTPCGPWGTFKLWWCQTRKCKGLSASECVTTICQDEYDALPEDCQLCLAANTTSPQWCAVWPGAREYAWKGHNGLMLLSKLPLEQPKYTPFEALLVKRGLITATVKGRTVHCTHLSANLSAVPYPEGEQFSSWQDEQADQLARIEAETDPDSCTVLLGDLNTGPATDTLTGEVPQTFDMVLDKGYVEPWDERQCTWCSDNPLTGDEHDRQLDHVMFKSCPQATYMYTRLMDEPITVYQSCFFNYCWNETTTRLSDHYGVRVDLVTPATLD